MRRVEEAWERLCLDRGLFWRFVLLPLSTIYGAVSVCLRLGRPVCVEGLKVISVGNLSMGGSGKTPLVIEIARMLGTGKLAILSRGHGGDEGPMLGKELPGAKLIFGANRLRSAREARDKGCQVALLDDGFQRRHQLGRNLDILVLDWQRRDLEAHCLPAGRLREPLRYAGAANAVVVTHAPKDWNPAALRAGIPASYHGLPVFRADHAPVALRGLDGRRRALSWLHGRPVIAMSGIGRPDAFEAALSGLGASVTPLRFADHHAYAAADLPREGTIVTTAKDAVKLAGLTRGDLWVLEMRMRIQDPRQFEALLK